MKKKVIAGLLLSSCVLGLAMPAFAQEIDGTGTADIPVNGTLGADNTEPDAEIPEGEEGWINVTVPTTTVFYNTTTVEAIKSPTYEIVNNSGRPVKVSISDFKDGTENSGLDLPSLAFDLKVKVDKTDGTDGTETPVVNQGVVEGFTTPTQIVELANSKGQSSADDPEVTNPTTNKRTFTYTGTATATTQVQPKYTMTLKFDAVAW